jgi:hypothetical protein
MIMIYMNECGVGGRTAMAAALKRPDLFDRIIVGTFQHHILRLPLNPVDMYNHTIPCMGII